jgi:hypothetical protein
MIQEIERIIDVVVLVLKGIYTSLIYQIDY